MSATFTKNPSVVLRTNVKFLLVLKAPLEQSCLAPCILSVCVATAAWSTLPLTKPSALPRHRRACTSHGFFTCFLSLLSLAGSSATITKNAFLECPRVPSPTVLCTPRLTLRSCCHGMVTCLSPPMPGSSLRGRTVSSFIAWHQHPSQCPGQDTEWVF